jgi:hypothetical protein
MVLFRDRELQMRGMWRPTKEEIREWWNTKEIEFAVDQNHNPWINAKEWLQRYVFTYLHEIFFVDFLNVLEEWIQRFIEQICKILNCGSEELDS